MAIFRPDVILHIEDDKNWRSEVRDYTLKHEDITNFYGNPLRCQENLIDQKLDEAPLESAIDRIKSEVDKNSQENYPSLVQVVSGQIARTFIADYLPGAIISDTGFPMNGEKTVEWLISHDLQNYPLIGLSGTYVDDLKPGVRDFFLKTNARYFNKGEFEEEDLRNQVIFNIGYNIKTGHEKYTGLDLAFLNNYMKTHHKDI